MKITLPYYLVALFAGFVYAIVHNYYPTLPLTEEQIVWIVVAILTALNVDVTQALRARGLIA